jgi:hypothetical protein
MPRDTPRANRPKAKPRKPAYVQYPGERPTLRVGNPTRKPSRKGLGSDAKAVRAWAAIYKDSYIIDAAKFRELDEELGYHGRRDWGDIKQHLLGHSRPGRGRRRA